jgi:hypothetical protein
MDQARAGMEYSDKSDMNNMFSILGTMTHLSFSCIMY